MPEHRTYNFSSGQSPRDNAIFELYHSYRAARDVSNLHLDDALAAMAIGFAKYLLDHPEELAAMTKEME